MFCLGNEVFTNHISRRMKLPRSMVVVFFLILGHNFPQRRGKLRYESFFMISSRNENAGRVGGRWNTSDKTKCHGHIQR